MRLTSVIQQPATAAEASAMVGTKRRIEQTVAIGRVADSRSKRPRLMVEGEELAAPSPTPASVPAPAPVLTYMWDRCSFEGPFRASPKPLASPARPPVVQRLTDSTASAMPYRGRPHSACFGNATNTSSQTTQEGGVASASPVNPVSSQVSHMAVAVGAGAERACPSAFETDVVRPGILTGILSRPLAIRLQVRTPFAAEVPSAAPRLAAALAAATADRLQPSRSSAFVAITRTASVFSMESLRSAATQVATAAPQVAADLFEPRPNRMRRPA